MHNSHCFSTNSRRKEMKKNRQSANIKIYTDEGLIKLSSPFTLNKKKKARLLARTSFQKYCRSFDRSDCTWKHIFISQTDAHLVWRVTVSSSLDTIYLHHWLSWSNCRYWDQSQNRYSRHQFRNNSYRPYNSYCPCLNGGKNWKKPCCSFQ